jgi:hypothetical protein
MSETATRVWLRPRLAAAPPELAADIVTLLETTPGLDLTDPVAALAGAALAGLSQVADGTGERTEALRLLAADAALTYAFEAAAEVGRSAELAALVGLGGELGRRLEREVREVREGTLPGRAAGS